MCLYKCHIYCMFKYISNLCYNGLPKTSETKGVELRQFNSNIKQRLTSNRLTLGG